MKSSAALVVEVPPGVVTVVLTVPAASPGVVAVISVEVTTLKEVAAVVPNVTALVPVNPVPTIVTAVPPPSGPALGVTLLTVGTLSKLNWSADEVVEVPPGVVTVVSTVPAASLGVVAVISVELTTLKEVAAVVPNLTALTEVKAVPVIVTTVPPPLGPALGDTLVTVGTSR